MKGRAPHNGRDTSREAAEEIEPKLARLQAVVLDVIRNAGLHGATCDEVERRLRMRHQTVSPRIYELHLRSRIRDSGRRRLTRSKRSAIVWVVQGLLVALLAGCEEVPRHSSPTGNGNLTFVTTTMVMLPGVPCVRTQTATAEKEP